MGGINMKKRINAAVAAGLSFLLLTGCYSSPAAKQAAQPPSVQPSISPQVAENTVKAQPAAPSEVSPRPSQPENAPVPSASTDEPSKRETAVEQQKVTPKQNDGQQREAGAAESQPSPQTSGQTDSTASAGTTGETVEQVTGKYVTQLTELKGWYTGQLQNLYSQAAAAQKSGKQNREIYDTYSQKAMALEEDSQAKVNQLLLQLKNELTAHHFSLDSVNELRTSYYAEMNKAKENFSEKTKSDFGM